MKFMKHFTFVFFIIAGIFLTSYVSVKAVTDEFTNCIVTVDTRDDGSLNVKYHLEFVDNSFSHDFYGFVKIGVPNRFVDDFKALSDNIKNIKYISDDGSFLRIYYDNNSVDGNISLDFSFNQLCMYSLIPVDNVCRFHFTPSWFDRSIIHHLEIRWNQSSVIESNFQRSDGKYYVWESDFDGIKDLSLFIDYDFNHFITDVSFQFLNDHVPHPEFEKYFNIMAIIVLAFGIFIISTLEYFF